VISVKVITREDDIQGLVKEINSASWDDANEMTTYDVEALSDYLDHQGTVFLACHDTVHDRSALLGIASARLEVKPYDRERWLYIDEVDVCADQRQKGAGKAIIRKFIAIAEEAGCEEVWLGTESDNQAANALYRSLDPDDIAQVIGYTYEIEEQ
jgi:ribosomal protein S18 acetylase RimI-like enzyme